MGSARTSWSGNLLRGTLGAALFAWAVVWILSASSDKRTLVTIGGHPLTRVDLPAVPLALAGLALIGLAVAGRATRPARAAAVLLVVAGVSGWFAVGWLSQTPIAEGQVLARLSRRHGLTESDLVVLPVLAVGMLAGLAGLVEALRAVRRQGSQPMAASSEQLVDRVAQQQPHVAENVPARLDHVPAARDDVGDVGGGRGEDHGLGRDGGDPTRRTD